MIYNERKAKQLIDFEGLIKIPGQMPTDLDGLFEYDERYFIFFEVKQRGKQVPIGQKLALTRLVNEIHSRPAILIICDHDKENPEDRILLKDCTVRTAYFKNKWQVPQNIVSVEEFVTRFIKKYGV